MDDTVAADAADAAGGRFDVYIPHELVCPIMGDFMEDPVVAEDGRSYERDMIAAWFAQCTASGQPCTSPVTREPMGSRLVENGTLKRTISELREQQSRQANLTSKGSPVDSPPGTPLKDPATGKGNCNSSSNASGSERSQSISSVQQLGEVFAQLDPLRELLAKCLDGWQPPALVAVGNENSGKSTLLERLCMMPMFPHDKEVCTRLPIQVRLRRGPAVVPRLEVINAETSAKEGEIAVVPMESAHVDVRREMDRLVKLQNKAIRGITSKRTIVLHVQSPSMPNIDLIDLPGVIESPGAGEPDDMPAKTQDLVKAQIDSINKHSMFLCTVEATMAPNSSTALKLLREKGVLDKTIGVITKCDYAVAPEQKEQVRSRLLQLSKDTVVLEPHGYVATTIATKSEYSELSNLEKLERQAAAETEFFAEANYQDLVDAWQVTTDGLLSRINTTFVRYVQDSWVPDTLSKLAAERKRLQDANTALGLPATHGTTLEELRKAAEAAIWRVLEKEKSWVMEQFSEHMQKLSKDLEAALPREPKTLFMKGETSAVSAYLDKIQSRVRALCEEANDDQQRFAVWLRLALGRESSPFKLSRFPDIASCFQHSLRKLLAPIMKQFDEAVLNNNRAFSDCGYIAQQLCIQGAAVSITHDWTASPITTTVSLDHQKIIGAISELYAPARLHILETQLSNPAVVTEVVERAIGPETEDPCNTERLDLLKKINDVDSATNGIRLLTSRAVRCIRHPPCWPTI